VFGFDPFGIRQIGNGARHPHEAIKAAHGEAETVGKAIQQVAGGAAEGAAKAQLTTVHMHRIPPPATGAGVGRRHQLKLAGEAQALPGPGDVDGPLFQGFPQVVQTMAAKFRQLVKKQDPVMSQADFTGQGVG